MSSDRPFTSQPAENSEDPNQAAEVNSSGPKIHPYIPHVFDLVTPTHRAEDATKLCIPRSYLQSEAVDASLLLGHGASFTVSRQTLPQGELILRDTVDMGTWRNKTVIAAPSRPKYVVYKSARVSFQANGEPATVQDRRALQSILTELYALLHPPLLVHPNIINFLALAWGSNPFEPFHKLPALVVEYADQGTLADLQSQKKDLLDEIKHSLCLGVAQGLSALHRNGIVHGDVKPENILICSHPKETFIAKIADFGFAIIESVESSEVSIGGTRTWKAPESSAPVPQDLLRKTDVYSFGLLAWSIAIDGANPFMLMVPDSLSGEDYLVAVDLLKERDQVLMLSKFDHWIFQSKVLAELQSRLPSMDANSRGFVSMIPDPERVQKALVGLSEEPAGLSAQLSAQRKQLSSLMCQLYRTKVFYKNLESLFLSTLSKDPNARNLEDAIGFLKDGHEIPNAMEALTLNPNADDNNATANPSINRTYNITNQSSKAMHFKRTPIILPSSSVEKHRLKPKAQNQNVSKYWKDLGFKNRIIYLQQMRDLEPTIQNFVAKAFLNSEGGPSQFCLSAFYLNGYGLEVNMAKSLASLAKAAASGHPLSQAYLSRMYVSCLANLPPDVQIHQYLEKQALHGSRMALQDLKIIDLTKAKHIRKMLKLGYAGVGAPWFTDDQMLHGLSPKALMDREFSLEELRAESGGVNEIKVNQRGDYILHGAAATGCFQLVESLLKIKDIKIDHLNAKGETALLCACRSGHAEIVMLLLDNGAKASIQATNGENPLHWLLSFDEEINTAALGEDLIKRGGADVNAFTIEHIAYSVFPGTIDVDFQVEGTPLMWAVHHDCPRIVRFLLLHGADPNWTYPGANISPLEWAAFYHHAECLELMVNHLETVIETPKTTEGKSDLRFAVVYGPLVGMALRASDTFSMILRNGPKYLEKLHATLRLLQSKTILINFTLGNRGETVFYLAASKGHDEAVEFMLQSGWESEVIDKSCGDAGRTPLLESVRWNRRALFHLLHSHGADVKALARNPYDESRNDWSALHILANEGHNENLELVDDLLVAGLPVDGPNPTLGIETPFNVAVRKNAFRLADMLLSRGADLNSLSTHSSLVISPFPLTGLGHIIALNARYSSKALQYMLSPKPRSPHHAIDFIVEPARKISALHLAALVPDGFKSASEEDLAREDFDLETNRVVVHELLEWYKTSEELDLKCGVGGKTALHIAVERGNVGVVEELVKAGADIHVRCEMGTTAVERARSLYKEQPMLHKLLAWLQ